MVSPSRPARHETKQSGIRFASDERALIADVANYRKTSQRQYLMGLVYADIAQWTAGQREAFDRYRAAQTDLPPLPPPPPLRHTRPHKPRR